MISPTISRRRKRKSGLKAIILVFIAILFVAAFYLNSLLDIITGYAAKNLASGVFISERTQEDLESTDLNFSFIALTRNRVDPEKESVTSRFLWGKSTAVYREGFGVTLLRDIEMDEIKSVTFPKGIEPGYISDTIQWPMGDIMPDSVTSIDLPKLSGISDQLVQNDSYGGAAYAFMVVHKGIPVAEAYKRRFDKETRFLSWSMGKSVTNSLVGVMSGKGMVDIYKPVDLPLWTDDSRASITLNNLMQMQSGLHWNEDYGNRSDITVMLHEVNDFAEFAYNQDLDYEPGTHWHYSSGNANIISYIIRQKIGNDNDYYAFPHREFFYRIGITDAIFEVDASGTMVGSSYLYMTARDYARFGLLYLQDGLFCGERVLPEGWVDYTTEPGSASDGKYGSLFWLERSDELPLAPEDMYLCVGHDGQKIFILPSQELVVVVLGYSPDNSMDFNRLISDILNTLDK